MRLKMSLKTNEFENSFRSRRKRHKPQSKIVIFHLLVSLKVALFSRTSPRNVDRHGTQYG